MNLDTRQTIRQWLLAMGAFGIVLVGPISNVFSLAVAPQAVAWANIVLKAKQVRDESNEFARYESAQFSVDYPRGWEIAPQGTNGAVIVRTADDVHMPIRTDIVLLRENPQTAVPQRLDQIVAEALSVQRYSLVAVDGQSGFRVWYEPKSGQQALTTFVGYGDAQTVILSSEYAQDEAVEHLVTKIHESFVNHSIAQASTP